MALGFELSVRIRQLDRIEDTLQEVLNKMNEQENALDNAIKSVSDQLARLQASVQSVVDVLGNQPDLADETSALSQVAESLGEASDALDAAVTPPPPPA